jgi:hypothetical protein
MSREFVFEDLLAVLDVVVLERRLDGSFVPLVPVPGWFAGLEKDGTFPFLGTFLEEATQFWAGTVRGRLPSGLCAATNAEGREFHFEAVAVAISGRHLLLFELPRGVDDLRSILQEAREEKLARAGLERLLDLRTQSMRDVRADLRQLGEGLRDAARRGEQPSADASRELAARLDRLEARLTDALAGIKGPAAS